MNKLMLPSGYRNAELLHQKLQAEPEQSWIHAGQHRAVYLFHEMSQRVPAYKDFLHKHHLNPASIKTFADFHKIPPLNKDNYLRAYPKEALCWDGTFPQGRWVISTTSGSTGEPYYFPRESTQDRQYAITAELYLRNNFQIQDKSTLYIVAFPMGAWIGGLFTYEALRLAAENGDYNLSIITPGIHKQEVINAVKQLGNNYDQIIIGAYAPFLKDILSDGLREGIRWDSYDLGFVFSAEAFTEKFRDYVIETCRLKSAYTSTLNHYGTVDLGTMAHETPESILIRRLLVEQNALTALFPEPVRQPTFAQYNPELFYFEEEEHSLLCTAFSGLPLVRYDLRDYGGVLSRSEAHDRLKGAGFDITQEIERHGLSKNIWNLPFVYVYERNDFSVSYYAFLIYPDMVRRALQADIVSSSLTGKFTMYSDYADDGRQKLHVHIELNHGLTPSTELALVIGQHLHQHLIRESSEYRETVKMVGEEAHPVIHLWTYEDATYFRPGTKQKWVIT